MTIVHLKPLRLDAELHVTQIYLCSAVHCYKSYESQSVVIIKTKLFGLSIGL